MSIAFVQDQGLVKIEVNSSSNYQVYLYTGTNEPTTESALLTLNNEYKISIGGIEEELELLGDFSSNARIFYKFYDTAKTIYVIIASLDNNVPTIREVNSATINPSDFVPGNITLGSIYPATIGFLDTPPTVTSSGVALKLDNIKTRTSFINGASYSLQIVKVVNAQTTDLDSISKYSELKNSGYRYSTVQEIGLSSDVEAMTTYDTSTQYKDNVYYTYVAFLYVVLGNKYGGWKVGAVSSKIAKEQHTVIKRDVDDLYVEDEVERIVAAQNANKFQTIATKKFPVISEGGGYIYSIILRSTVDLCADENIGLLPTKLQEKGLIKYSGVKDEQNNENTYGDAKLSSYQLSGIGKIEDRFRDYYPRIDGTLKLSLSDK